MRGTTRRETRAFAALLAATGLLAGSASYGAPVAAGDCEPLQVASVTGPPQLAAGATGTYVVTINNPNVAKVNNPNGLANGDPCNDGMKVLITTGGALRPTGTIIVGNGVACTDEPANPAAMGGPTTGGYRCVAVSLKGGAMATLTASVEGTVAGQGRIGVHPAYLSDDIVALPQKSLAVTVTAAPPGGGAAAPAPGGGAPAPSTQTSRVLPTVRIGAPRGETVKTIQYLLREHGEDIEFDGVFGEQTDAAVRNFQDKKGLTADGKGVVGPRTWQALFVTVKMDDEGDAVIAVQSQLAARGVDVVVDGEFGEQTEGAVLKFQHTKGLVEDGEVGPQTWAALVAAD